MRLEDSLNQTAGTSNLPRKPKPADKSPASALAPTTRQDSVTISPAARRASLAQIEAQAMKEQEKKPLTADSQAKKEYKKFMDKILWRNLNEDIPRTKKEKREALIKKLEELKDELEKLQSNPDIPEKVKQEQEKDIQERINAAVRKIAELTQLIDEEGVEGL